LHRADEFNLNNKNSRVILPAIIVQNIPVTISFELTDTEMLAGNEDIGLTILVNGKPKNITFHEGRASFSYTFSSRQKITIEYGEVLYEKEVNPIPLWMSVIPPLIAILIALIFKEVISALFIGLLFGTSIISFYQGNSFFIAIGKGLFSVIDTYILQSLTDSGHVAIILFSMMIGGMVALITRNGGMKGIVTILSKYASSPRSGQFVTWLLGVAIFFDDYANTLIVGNTMRPVTDKLKISREKLAYIVDSTAAPVAALALTTTWIGIEVGYIQEGIDAIGIDKSAYLVFINSLSTRFYPFFTLVFILILVFKKRDFGPMLAAERNARNQSGTKQIQSVPLEIGESDFDLPHEKKQRWYNAAIPVLVVVFGTFAGLLITGWDQLIWQNTELPLSIKFSEIIGHSDSYQALLWASFSGLLVAVFLSVSQKILNLNKSISFLVKGFSTMLNAVLILILAWSLALITQHMHTANYLADILVNMNLSPFLLPAITFILSAVISFSTGSSWGTMAILYPLILPVSWTISQKYGMDYNASIAIFYNVVSSILAGSVFGDHCSPISDTTILSSLASSCPHIDHVRTQLPYALTVGAVSIMLGTLPAAYGISPWILFPAGLLVLYLVVVVFGKKIET
jgi:Na+/H+ antiporter NhaC